MDAVQQLGRRLSVLDSGTIRKSRIIRREQIVSMEMCGHVSCGCRATVKYVRSSNKVKPLRYKSESRGFDSRVAIRIFR